MVGAEGLTPAVLKEADAALKAHGLIKVRVFSDDREARSTLLVDLAEHLNAAPVQHIGKLLVLWRPVPTKDKALPAEGKPAGPRVVRVLKAAKSATHRPQLKKVTVLGNQRLTAAGNLKRAKKRAVSLKKRALEG